jgi:OOP family OmpA-OmpF porin
LGKKRHIFLSIAFSLLFFCSVADNPFFSDSKFAPKPRRKSKISWIFTAGWNAVDDNSDPFKKLLAFRKVWNLPFYPSFGSAEIIGNYGLTYGACFSFNRYKPGKEINGNTAHGRALFFGFDGFAKYHANEHIAMSKQYDPYALLGAGYTLRFIAPNFSAFTGNIGLGMNYWIDNHWGLNVQSLAQFGIKKKFPRSSANYLHHSIGVVYIIDNTFRKNRSFVKPRYKWIHDNHNVGERRR